MSSSGEKAGVRRWLDRGLRMLRGAAVVVGLMALVPVAIVLVRGDSLARMMDITSNGTRERREFAERMRAFSVAPDASISPMQAGLALNALIHDGPKVPGFETIELAGRPVFSWHASPLAADLFVTARPDVFVTPSNRGVLEATAHGLSDREMRYLKEVATAPVWRDFDLVAHAPAVDVIGGQFVVPFGEGVTPEQRPIPRLRDARELAYVAVSRAAYHMAVGQRDSAEAVLRSIVSFGFALIDNGPALIDEMVGAVIVGTGRDALQRYYVIQHDPRAASRLLQAPNWSASGDRRSSSAQVRSRMLARLEDSRVPRGERFEIVRALSLASCTNARELMFGPRAEVTDAIERARRSLPRYASERALLDLQAQPLGVWRDAATSGPLQTLAVSAASVPATLLGNPRLESCTRLLTGW